jgi:ferritin-like protein
MDMNLHKILNDRLGEEFSAWYTYWFLYQVAKGKAYEFLSKTFEEHAEDELNDHAKRLITWMQANNIDVDCDLKSLVDRAKGGSAIPIDLGDGYSTEKAIKAVIKSERWAIQGYKDSYNAVKDTYPDLGQMFLEISNDEQEHLNNDLDIASQIGLNGTEDEVMRGTSLSGVSSFSQIVSKLRNKNFGIRETEELGRRVDYIYDQFYNILDIILDYYDIELPESYHDEYRDKLLPAFKKFFKYIGVHDSDKNIENDYDILMTFDPSNVFDKFYRNKFKTDVLNKIYEYVNKVNPSKIESDVINLLD